MSATAPTGGSRWVCAADLPVTGITHWEAPFSGGFDALLPAGSVLVLLDDRPVPGASAAGCMPEDAEALEALLVPEEDRVHPRYAGYHLVVPLTAFGTSLVPAP